MRPAGHGRAPRFCEILEDGTSGFIVNTKGADASALETQGSIGAERTHARQRAPSLIKQRRLCALPAQPRKTYDLLRKARTLTIRA